MADETVTDTGAGVEALIKGTEISDVGGGSEALNLLIDTLLREMIGVAEDISTDSTLGDVSDTGEGVDTVTVKKEQSCKITSTVRPLYVMNSVIRGLYEMSPVVRGLYEFHTSMRGG